MLSNEFKNYRKSNFFSSIKDNSYYIIAKGINLKIIKEIGKIIDSTNNELEEDCIVANDFSYQNYMFCSNKYYTINNDGHFTYI